MNAVDLFLDHPASDAAPCILTLEGEHSYGQVRQAVNLVASFLTPITAKGDRIGILAENSFFYVAAYLGILRAGAVAVPLPPNLTLEHARFIAESTQMQGAFLQSKAAEEYKPALAGLTWAVLEAGGDLSLGEGCRLHAFPDLGGASAPPTAFPGIDAKRDLALLLFTSGSTSQPRGVMLTHQNLIANSRSILEYMKLGGRDRVMVVLPFYYSFGASLLHTHLAAGAALVIDRRFMFPDKVLKRMEETGCTGLAGVPSHFQILLRKSSLKSMSLPTLRWLQQAGGKLPNLFIEELVDTLPQAKLFVMYGATEATARISYLPPELLPDKLGSIGKGIPGVRIFVLDEAGHEVSPGEVGEVVVEGDNVALGYWQAPAESEATFRHGRLHTGDLARTDEDGFIYIVDRAKDFIKCGGSRVSSKQLEETLLGYEGLVEAAVLGTPDDVLGEAVSAFVVPRDAGDATLQENVLAFCREALPPHLVPRRLTVLSALPKNSAGKVLKQALRQAYP
jgi:long-chain acyl-CoA synthetase